MRLLDVRLGVFMRVCSGLCGVGSVGTSDRTGGSPVAASMLSVVSLAALCLLLSGCAGDATVPQAELSTGANPSRAVALSDADRNATCAALEGNIKAQVPRIKSLEAAAKSESQTAAPTLARTFARLFGPPGSDSKALADLQQERALTVAYNDALREKGCATISVEALLAEHKTSTASGGGALVSSAPPQAAASAVNLPDLQQVALPRGY